MLHFRTVSLPGSPVLQITMHIVPCRSMNEQNNGEDQE